LTCGKYWDKIPVALVDGVAESTFCGMSEARSAPRLGYPFSAPGHFLPAPGRLSWLTFVNWCNKGVPWARTVG